MAAPAGGHVVVDGPGALAAEVVHQLRRAGLAVRAGALAADAELAAGDTARPGLVVLVRDRVVPVWAWVVWLPPWLELQGTCLPVLPQVISTF